MAGHAFLSVDRMIWMALKRQASTEVPSRLAKALARDFELSCEPNLRNVLHSCLLKLLNDILW
jgi:hypothetical protein